MPETSQALDGGRMVLAVRMAALRDAIRGRDWESAEFEFDRVNRAITRADVLAQEEARRAAAAAAHRRADRRAAGDRRQRALGTLQLRHDGGGGPGRGAATGGRSFSPGGAWPTSPPR